MIGAGAGKRSVRELAHRSWDVSTTRWREKALAFLSPYRVTFEVVQIILAVALIVAILLQPRGSGLGSVFGGSGTVFKTRRGAERLLFRGTIVIAAAFFLCSFLNASIP